MSGLGPLWNRWSLRIIHLCYSLFMFTLILCFALGIETVCCNSYAKIVTTKSWMLLNLCQAFWASWTPCYTCWVRHVLMLVYFHYLDKNLRWVTDGYGNDDFPEDYLTCGQPINVPVIWGFHERSFLYTSATYMWRLCSIIHDVTNTCDATIHNLLAYVCDWSLGAYKIYP